MHSALVANHQGVLNRKIVGEHPKFDQWYSVPTTLYTRGLTRCVSFHGTTQPVKFRVARLLSKADSHIELSDADFS